MNGNRKMEQLWIDMQVKSGAEIYNLEKNADCVLYKTITKKEPDKESNWNTIISAMYHVFDCGKWILATENQKEAFDLYNSIVKSHRINE